MVRLWRAIPQDSRREVLVQAVTRPRNRSGALHWLLLSYDEELRQGLFPHLVDLASVGHSDIGLVRQVIKSMPRQWVIDHISPLAHAVLDRQAALGAEDRYEEFRRFGELFAELDPSLLRSLIRRAECDADSDVREVGEDLRGWLGEAGHLHHDTPPRG
jgi:hypothetical protein